MKFKRLVLIKSKSILGKEPPSFDVINEFQNVIIDNENCGIKNSYYYNNTFLKHYFLKLGHKIYRPSNKTKSSKIYFSILMGPDFGKLFPYLWTNANVYTYIFDIWPKFFDITELFLKKTNVKHVFFSSKYAADYFQSKGFSNVSWIPEGIKFNEYKYNDNKDIDILELGRKYDFFHEKLKNSIYTKNINHLYESKPGKIIFENKSSLVQGLAKTKISICFPKNITHSEVAGPISTMTNRYLQSMASKCLIVGSAPEEMKELFGYNPVIEIDQYNPALHIHNILNNINDYQPLIERNYKNVINNHSWAYRWKKIKTIISKENHEFFN